MEIKVSEHIVKKSLFVKLVNTERNESLVEQSISKEFLDLSAVVRVVLKMDKEGMTSKILSKGNPRTLIYPICKVFLKNTLTVRTWLNQA